MRIIPVIDLMRGQVVRGVGGRREEYRPIESVLALDARPASVARALALAGFREVYVADLDAILGGPPSWSIYADLIACGLQPWVDAGPATAEQALALAKFTDDGQQLSAVVAGLESIVDPATLGAIGAAVGYERLIFSLDLKNGVPLAGTAWNDLTALQIATIALRTGVRRMIILDLASVGMGQGVGTERLCRQLRCLDERLQIIAGGGVRGPADLETLAAAGCDAALVASALHDGRLAAGDCAAMR